MPFELQPHLVGDILNLRPLREDDYPALFSVASDPLVWQQHPASDRYKDEVFRQFFRDAIDSGGALVVIDAANDAVIGSSRYHDYSEADRTVEIGWSFLARDYWGGIYNGEMKRLMLQHAFQFVDSVHLVIGETNMRSQKAAEKIGAVHIGTRSDEAMGVSNVFAINQSSYALRTLE